MVFPFVRGNSMVFPFVRGNSVVFPFVRGNSVVFPFVRGNSVVFPFIRGNSSNGKHLWHLCIGVRRKNLYLPAFLRGNTKHHHPKPNSPTELFLSSR
jgi:hypothetical protein